MKTFDFDIYNKKNGLWTNMIIGTDCKERAIERAHEHALKVFGWGAKYEIYLRKKKTRVKIY